MHDDREGVPQDLRLEGVESRRRGLPDLVLRDRAAGLRDVDLLVDEGRDARAGTEAARRVDGDLRERVLEALEDLDREGLDRTRPLDADRAADRRCPIAGCGRGRVIVVVATRGSQERCCCQQQQQREQSSSLEQDHVLTTSVARDAVFGGSERLRGLAIAQAMHLVNGIFRTDC